MSGRSDYENWLSEAIGAWPIAKGSLTEVRKTCGKAGCRRCTSGEKHPAWLFMYRLDSKACSMHVPKALVPLVETAIANGHRLERQLVESGIALIRNRAKK